jgi:hypothetical protein
MARQADRPLAIVTDRLPTVLWMLSLESRRVEGRQRVALGLSKRSTLKWRFRDANPANVALKTADVINLIISPSSIFI